MLDILDTVNKWLQDGQSVALATVVETWGSAPRQVGSKLAVTPDLAMTGSVSGGCVEGAVIEEALEGLKDGKPRLLKFGVADDTAWEVGLTCGGKINIFAEPLDRIWWQMISGMAQKDQQSKTVTILEGANAGQKILLDSDGEVIYLTNGVGVQLCNALRQTAQGYANSQRTTVMQQEVMVDVYQPRPHLIIIGGAHVAMPLQIYARELGFRVSLVDPRSAFATQERFPDVSAIMHSYPNKALPELGLTTGTYVAVLTHDPKIDDPALITALNSTVPYVGVLSSKKTHEKRVQRLKAAGITDEQIAQIHTPAGIDIDARTPEEIALSIMAEIIAVKNGKIQ